MLKAKKGQHGLLHRQSDVKDDIGGKIGQLNLPVAGTIITGQAQSSDVAGRIKAGQVGGLFNLKGAAEIRRFRK